MPTQQEQFNTALAGLTPEQQLAYKKANPNIGVGGVQQTLNSSGSYVPNLSFPVNNTINAEKIGGVTPFKITNSLASTGLTGLQGAIELGTTSSVASELKASEDRLRQSENDAKQAKMNTSSQSLVDKLLGRKGQAGFTAEENSRVNELGTTVNQTADAVKKANQEILNEQYSNRKQQEALLANPMLTRQQAQQQISELDRKSVSKQADLYIKKLALQGDYDSAKSIADQFVNARFEQQQNEIDAAKIIYEDNKDSFTKAEERLYNETWTKKQNDLNIEKEKAKQLSDINITLLQSASSQNAPQSVIDAISRATTTEGKIIAAGRYAGNILETQIKQEQLNKLKEEIAKIKKDTTESGIPQFDTTTEAGQLASTAQNLASKFNNKFSQEQFLSNVKRLTNTGDTKQLADYIFSEAISNIGDTDTRKKAFGNYRVVKQLSMLESQLAAYEAGGGDTNLLIGKKENVLAKLGTVQNVELRKIGTAITNTLDELARARTGAVISESEEKMYRQILPGIDKTASLNKAIISGLNTSLTNDIDSILKFQLTGSGFDTISKYLKPEISGTSSQQTVKSNGQDYVVGLVYNDGTAYWVIDASGKWTKK